MKKILLTFGTRPEYIKIKPLINPLLNSGVECGLLFVKQHSDLIGPFEHDSEVSVHEIEINNTTGNRLNDITASILSSADLTKITQQYDAVLVQGDTTTAFAVALHAFHTKKKLIHLEAGMRTWDKNNPFPEEFNRVAITRMADYHFCPTLKEYENVYMDIFGQIPLFYTDSEQDATNIYVIGNTSIDNLNDIEPNDVKQNEEDIVLITMHRRENHENIEKWFENINELAKDNQELKFIFPAHPNPNVQKHLGILTHVDVIAPLQHSQFKELLLKAKIVITDSGGVQEESAYLRKPCIVCREKTERNYYISGTHAKSPGCLFECFEWAKKGWLYGDDECAYGSGNAGKRFAEIVRKNEILS